MIVSELVEIYLCDVKPMIRWSTFDTKAHMLRSKFAPFFKNKQAGEVTSLNIVRWQGWVDTLRQRNGKPYAQTYVHALNSQVSPLFNYAEENYGLKPNPTKKVKKTKSARSAEMQFWTREEYDAFLHAASNKDLSFYAFEVLYWTGIREGELLALCPEDIDLEVGTLRVSKTYARKGGQDYIGLQDQEVLPHGSHARLSHR